MAVRISGSLFSSLLFQLKGSSGDAVRSYSSCCLMLSVRCVQEGFLLGGVRSHSVADITDSQAHSVREEKNTCELRCFISCMLHGLCRYPVVCVSG